MPICRKQVSTPCRRLQGAAEWLGRVDGLNQHQTAGETDDGRVADVGLLAPHGDAFEPLELADCLFDARPQFVEALREKTSSLLGVFAARDNRCDATRTGRRPIGWLSYPLSVIAMRGRMSGPMSSDVSNWVLSLASPPVRWKSRGLPSRSVLRWILVEKPPRERPNAWRCCPLLLRQPKHGRALSCCRRTGSNGPSGCIPPAVERMPRILPNG